MILSDLIDLIKKGNSDFIGANIFEDLNIEDAASLDKADNHQISFLEENNILKEKLDQSKASAIITSNNNEIVTTLKKLKISNIIVKNPRIAFAEVLNCLYKTINYDPGIHSSAYVAKTAKIGIDSHIGHNVYIGENTVIGNNNIILPGSSILGNVQIGDNNIIHPNCVIYENTTLKNNCVINSNTVIGSEGFGFIPKDGKWVKMPQKGGVKIMSYVEIGTNCCVDRPSVGFTYIDEGTKLDNLVQIGHGVKIGKNCAFAAQVGIAGGAIIGDGVILAGQVGVNNRVKVGNNVIASSKCGIHCDIEDGKVISGFPAMNNKSWLRSSSIFKKLPELAKKLRQLDNQ
ncbi:MULTISPECIES: UDP-3-O-(3-hydroxymyristoyl)glucosamine N-acyltransferase [Prochlorococcus]|uniref:UDP-3-O-acylglucosamine N-acyltransferase n=1 Tax=Prochlorococcus marinus str. MIT 9116 TaxID=167544 RepID=A0A0A1ZP50_PROMR|nr:UDP-3-O-(3-hydroxymyristoyl)glucosamine N-acyltransferase [Prochlorococcus marinus]KGF89684.1 UDP-3-O-(3-hydroxymyristoyl) glucosamine N-acyltransferase [Prochlorococcus marinus str. MIT 9107]KGF90306.1 UDP-3-O-(3-hydroxymyristoyl) glucosamine N-acyltransferase [Prochlorococcus marinus str. MIT 9116]KGF92786.1 UDP-3-O-(3-hydroxymyristoyl) glucosamine N-acyltransferase [Prochlorococcus marinus str. MIT 9123]